MKHFKGALKPDRMSPDERLIALMKGKPLDRVPFMPFILGFSARNVGISLASFYSDPEKANETKSAASRNAEISGVDFSGIPEDMLKRMNKATTDMKRVDEIIGEIREIR